MDLSKFKIKPQNPIFTIYKIPFSQIEKANIGIHNGDASYSLDEYAKEQDWDIAINGAMFSMGKPTDKYYWWNVTNLIVKGVRQKYEGNYALGGIAFGNPFAGISAYGSNFANSTGKPVDFIGGAPTLIVNGKAKRDMTGIEAGFDTRLTQRTGIGVTKDSIIILSSLNNKTNCNAMLKEFVALGCTDAINLDGGGSTSLYVNGKVLRKGRNIPTAFGIKVKDGSTGTTTKPTTKPTTTPTPEKSTGIVALNIINGIIQNDSVAGVPFKRSIIENVGLHNVRTGVLMTETLGATIHNTANTAPTAGDEMHAKWLANVEKADEQYLGVHLFVDEDSITQCLPLTEVTYHAGDGKGDGNRKTIGIEICENGNILKAENNAKKLIACLLKNHPEWKIYKHQDWSGKYCPRVILDRNGWPQFVTDIKALVAGTSTTTEVPTGTTIGTTVTIKGATVKAYRTAKDAMAGTNSTGIVPEGTYEIMIQHSTGAYNIGKGYLYWINPKDLYIPKTYTVVKGDTLGKIALANMTTVKSLVAKNNIVDPNSIRVGQVLIIK